MTIDGGGDEGWQDLQSEIGVILAKMNDAESNKDDLCSSCAALANLAGGDTFDSRNTGNITHILRLHGLETILCSMTKFAYCTALQAQACKAIWRLGRNEESRKIIAQKCLSKILAAMRMHFDDVNVQEFGCAALLNLSPEPANKVLIADQALDEILMAMRTHPDSLRIIEKACALLRNLALETANASTLANRGLGDLVGVMRRNRDNFVIQILIFGIFSNMSYHVGSDRLIALQGLEAVVAAMQQHLNYEKVQTEALIVLWNLAFNSENKKLILDRGLSTLLASMNRHVDRPGIQALGCAVMANLVDHGEEQAGLKDRSAQEITMACVRAVRTHWDNDGVVEEGSWALLLLLLDKGPGAVALLGPEEARQVQAIAVAREVMAASKDRASAGLFMQAREAGHVTMMRKLLSRQRPAPGQPVIRAGYRATAIAASYLASMASSEGTNSRSPYRTPSPARPGVPSGHGIHSTADGGGLRSNSAPRGLVGPRVAGRSATGASEHAIKGWTVAKMPLSSKVGASSRRGGSHDTDCEPRSSESERPHGTLGEGHRWTASKPRPGMARWTREPEAPASGWPESPVTFSQSEVAGAGEAHDLSRWRPGERFMSPSRSVSPRAAIYSSPDGRTGQSPSSTRTRQLASDDRRREGVKNNDDFLTNYNGHSAIDSGSESWNGMGSDEVRRYQATSRYGAESTGMLLQEDVKQVVLSTGWEVSNRAPHSPTLGTWKGSDVGAAWRPPGDGPQGRDTPPRGLEHIDTDRTASWDGRRNAHEPVPYSPAHLPPFSETPVQTNGSGLYRDPVQNVSSNGKQVVLVNNERPALLMILGDLEVEPSQSDQRSQAKWSPRAGMPQVSELCSNGDALLASSRASGLGETGREACNGQLDSQDDCGSSVDVCHKIVDDMANVLRQLDAQVLHI